MPRPPERRCLPTEDDKRERPRVRISPDASPRNADWPKAADRWVHEALEQEAAQEKDPAPDDPGNAGRPVPRARRSTTKPKRSGG